ncbi:MAG TPA: PIN domain-containing protein [Anaerolineae bacterium]|jgi:predicted nucleic acid-binding protein
MASLEQQLAAHSVIGLDTRFFIYHLEAHPDYLPLTKRILKAVESGRWQAVTSTVTIMELTVQPWRINRPDIARQYEVLLANFPNLQIIEVNRSGARRAAQLRAIYNIRPADALQVGTAIINGATGWVSNDKKLKRLASILDVVILDEFIE